MTFHTPITAQTVHLTDHFRARFTERIGPPDGMEALALMVRAELDARLSDRVKYLGRQGARRQAQGVGDLRGARDRGCVSISAGCLDVYHGL